MAGKYRVLGPRKDGSSGDQLPELLYDDAKVRPMKGGDEKYESRTTRRTSPPRPRRLTSLIGLPMVLHLGVLALYIALCLVYAMGSNIPVDLTKASHIQSRMNFTSHVIMLGLSTVIVALMQPIATRTPFGHLPRSLTSLSDKLSSWSGLGSSLLNLYHNLRYPTTLGNAIITTLYFSSLSGLGASSSFLFNVPAVNQTTFSKVPTQIGSPSKLGLIPPGCNAPGESANFTTLTFEWYRSGMSIGMLNDNTTAFPGLSANRIYDTLLSPLPDSNTSAEVNYTEFHVQCGSVPQMNISVSDIDPDSAPYVVEYKDWNSTDWRKDSNFHAQLTINYPLGSTAMTLRDGLSLSAYNNASSVGRLWRPSDILLRVPNSNLMPGIGRNVVLYNVYNETGLASGSQPILDSENATGSPWPLAMQMAEGAFGTAMLVQVIGCSLTTSNGRATIDAATNQLINTTAAQEGGEVRRSTWDDWKPDLNNSISLEDTWASMFLPTIGSAGLWDSPPIPLLQTPLWSCFSMQAENNARANESAAMNYTVAQLQDMYDNCHIPTVIEDYLTTRLFGPVIAHTLAGDAVRAPSAANATLRALESALANATAMAMWSAARANTLTVSCPTYNVTGAQDEEAQLASGEFILPLSTVLAPVNGSTVVQGRKLAAHITIDVPSLVIGTALAVILTALGAYILIREDTARMADAPIRDAGLLSLMTLENSAIAARLSATGLQSAQARRRAGDFLVRIVDGRFVIVGDEEDADVKSVSDGDSESLAGK
ncbi:unnamed protein product [Peniophora sp. CBMAI 1063]|nr:unnamed protein product [Peniophora sp. CBMAI 1063]